MEHHNFLLPYPGQGMTRGAPIGRWWAGLLLSLTVTWPPPPGMNSAHLSYKATTDPVSEAEMSGAMARQVFFFATSAALFPFEGMQGGHFDPLRRGGGQVQCHQALLFLKREKFILHLYLYSKGFLATGIHSHKAGGGPLQCSTKIHSPSRQKIYALFPPKKDFAAEFGINLSFRKEIVKELAKRCKTAAKYLLFWENC